VLPGDLVRRVGTARPVSAANAAEQVLGSHGAAVLRLQRGEKEFDAMVKYE